MFGQSTHMILLLVLLYSHCHDHSHESLLYHVLPKLTVKPVWVCPGFSGTNTCASPDPGKLWITWDAKDMRCCHHSQCSFCWWLPRSSCHSCIWKWMLANGGKQVDFMLSFLSLAAVIACVCHHGSKWRGYLFMCCATPTKLPQTIKLPSRLTFNSLFEVMWRFQYYVDYIPFLGIVHSAPPCWYNRICLPFMHPGPSLSGNQTMYSFSFRTSPGQAYVFWTPSCVYIPYTLLICGQYNISIYTSIYEYHIYNDPMAPIFNTP